MVSEIRNILLGERANLQGSILKNFDLASGEL